MYLKLFGFTEKPFHITPNPRFIFLSKNHKEAFAHLLFGIQQRVGFMSLTGEVGTGKTTVLRTLLGQLAEADYQVALVFNPCLSAEELLQTIHREFSIDADFEQANLADLLNSLNQFLLRQREVGKTVVLVIDEAQNLAPDVLEQLRLLSNLETETEKLIQMILVGQPELDTILERRDLRQLRQRLVVRYKLQPMDEEDSCLYVQHRTKVAGWQAGELFSEKALTEIYRQTQGTPRLINILCDRALLVAYGEDSRSVSRKEILLAAKELSQQQEPATQRRLWPAWTLLVLLLAGGIAAWLLPVSEPIMAQKQPPAELAERPPAPAETKIVLPERPDPDEVQKLQETVAALPRQQTSRQAIAALATVWNRPLTGSVSGIESSRQLERALLRNGFAIAEHQGGIDSLLQADVPAILELVLPNVVGKRFLTLLGFDGQRVLLEPAISGDGWVGLPELEQIWFGKAYLPYLNVAEIGLIDRPGQSGAAVRALQQLLRTIDSSDNLQSGHYDTSTIAAVTRFQRRQQLTPDGRVGYQTLFWLYRKAGETFPPLADGKASL